MVHVGCWVGSGGDLSSGVVEVRSRGRSGDTSSWKINKARIKFVKIYIPFQLYLNKKQGNSVNILEFYEYNICCELVIAGNLYVSYL